MTEMSQKLAESARGGQPLIDAVRGSIDGMPGFMRRMATVKKVLPIVNLSSTYVIETCRTDEGYHGFIEAITPEGTFRLYLPTDVMKRLCSQHASVAKKSRSDRAKAAAETREAKGIIPFQPRSEADAMDDDDDLISEEE